VHHVGGRPSLLMREIPMLLVIESTRNHALQRGLDSVEKPPDAFVCLDWFHKDLIA